MNKKLFDSKSILVDILKIKCCDIHFSFLKNKGKQPKIIKKCYKLYNNNIRDLLIVNIYCGMNKHIIIFKIIELFLVIYNTKFIVSLKNIIVCFILHCSIKHLYVYTYMYIFLDRRGWVGVIG